MRTLPQDWMTDTKWRRHEPEPLMLALSAYCVAYVVIVVLVNIL